MNEARFNEITAKYPRLRIAVLGDFCLDRYLEIDPQRREISIETGLEVHNVVNVRSQPGGAGTILNNLVALDVGEIHAVGFCGEDGEGYELMRSLRNRRGVRTDHFLQTPERRTFTYCKPLLLERAGPPRELNRLDSKNWSPTPDSVRRFLRTAFETTAARADAMVLLDQVDVAETGVITADLLNSIRLVASQRPGLLMLADSRRSLKNWPPVSLKMNGAELGALAGHPQSVSIDQAKETAQELARSHGRPVFITLSENGIVGADPGGFVWHVPARPVRGPIDVVGAGDAVTANLTAALAAGAMLPEALELAMAAASIVVHQLGTTGTASVSQLHAVVFDSS